jgi:putative ABC transport system permease protein
VESFDPWSDAMKRGRRALDSLEADIRDHIERETADNLDRGMPPDEARRQALLTFGNVALTMEDTRVVWRWHWLEQLLQDCRYAIRTLRRRPAYALLSALTLALGIGGTASVYGVARGVLFDPLPFAHEREVGVFWKKTDWTHEEYLYIRGRVPGFSQVALYRQHDVIAREGDGPARLVRAVSASSELFDVLGAGPLLGRGFRAGDDVAGAEPVAILSFGLWQDMGGNPSIIGTRVALDDTRRTVVGVMRRGFWFPDPAVRIWMPERLNPESRNWNSTLVGRVAPHHDVRAMDAPAGQLAAMLGERFDYAAQWDKRQNPHITPVRDDVVGPMRPALFATLGAMALILLIGCANVAALVLGQVDARSTEFAVRSALGAKRLRLAQQLIVEVLLVAAGAGALGAALAWAGFTVISNALPLGAWAESAAPDWHVFASAMLIAVAASLLVMLVPVISLYHGDLRGLLSGIRTGGIHSRGGRLENSLVIVQVALAVMIAAGATLLARSVANLYAVEPGVRTDGVAVVDLVLRGGGNRVRHEQALTELLSALRALPGVHSVGAAQQLPLRDGGYRMGLTIPERPEIKPLATEYRIVTPGYLESMGIDVRHGRTINNIDRQATERVVVINEAFAQQHFPGIDPLGKLVSEDAAAPSRIVGVVANAAEKRLIDPAEPVRYVALAQMPWMDEAQSLVLRAMPGADETSLLEAARRTIARVVPGAAVQQTTTMRRVLDAAIGPARQVVMLLSLMTALSLILGAIGVYGVIAHYAARRRRDWAIRVALGLPGSRVISHVVGHGALLVTAGIVVGGAGAAMLTRLLSSFLYGVSAIDPIAFVTAGAALLAVGTVAALLPAWRAGTADPLIALREQ